MPFLQLVMSHRAVSHLSKADGGIFHDSSNLDGEFTLGVMAWRNSKCGDSH